MEATGCVLGMGARGGVVPDLRELMFYEGTYTSSDCVRNSHLVPLTNL